MQQETTKEEKPAYRQHCLPYTATLLGLDLLDQWSTHNVPTFLKKAVELI